MVKQKKTLINLRTNEWKGVLSRPTCGYLIGAHNYMFSSRGYCAEKGERVLPRENDVSVVFSFFPGQDLHV
jgi:hypothetical protein